MSEEFIENILCGVCGRNFEDYRNDGFTPSELAAGAQTYKSASGETRLVHGDCKLTENFQFKMQMNSRYEKEKADRQKTFLENPNQTQKTNKYKESVENFAVSAGAILAFFGAAIGILVFILIIIRSTPR
jgi:hypothetical protein